MPAERSVKSQSELVRENLLLLQRLEIAEAEVERQQLFEKESKHKLNEISEIKAEVEQKYLNLKGIAESFTKKMEQTLKDQETMLKILTEEKEVIESENIQLREELQKSMEHNLDLTRQINSLNSFIQNHLDRK